MNFIVLYNGSNTLITLVYSIRHWFYRIFITNFCCVKLTIPCTIAIVSHSYTCNTISYITYIWLEYYPSIDTLSLSAYLITRNFSCTDVNNNLQLSYLSWAKCCTTLLTDIMKGLRCTARISLGYKVILVLQLKSSLKTHIWARFNNHVTPHVTHKIDEQLTSGLQQYNSKLRGTT